MLNIRLFTRIKNHFLIMNIHRYPRSDAKAAKKRKRMFRNGPVLTVANQKS